jgi:hypothetical protein
LLPLAVLSATVLLELEVKLKPLSLLLLAVLPASALLELESK